MLKEVSLDIQEAVRRDWGTEVWVDEEVYLGVGRSEVNGHHGQV